MNYTPFTKYIYSIYEVILSGITNLGLLTTFIIWNVCHDKINNNIIIYNEFINIIENVVVEVE